MTKLFKNYKNLEEYKKDKICVDSSFCHLWSYGADPENNQIIDGSTDIVAYNTICFIEEENLIYKNNINYTNNSYIPILVDDLKAISNRLTELENKVSYKVAVVNKLPETIDQNTIYYVV